MARNLQVPCVDEPPYYFVSYNAGDEKIVSEYAVELVKQNCNLWYDNGIKIGTKWETEIVEKMEKCEAVIMFLGKNIFTKENSYVHKEYELAKEYFHKDIYVVILDDISNYDVPNRFKMWWIDVNGLQCVMAPEYDSPESCIKALCESMLVQERSKPDNKTDVEEPRKLPDEMVQTGDKRNVDMPKPEVNNPNNKPQADSNNVKAESEKFRLKDIFQTIRKNKGRVPVVYYAKLISKIIGACYIAILTFFALLLSAVDVELYMTDMYVGITFFSTLGTFIFGWSTRRYKGGRDHLVLLLKAIISAMIINLVGPVISLIFQL